MPLNAGNHLPNHPDGTPVKVTAFTAQWAGTDVSDKTNQFDVCELGDDGNLYHFWYQPGQGWNGPETLNHLT